MRKGKLLLALSAVKRALAIGGPADPVAHRMVVRFALQAQDASRPVRCNDDGKDCGGSGHACNTCNSARVFRPVVVAAVSGHLPRHKHDAGISSIGQNLTSCCLYSQASPAVVQQVIRAQLQRILGEQALPAYQAQFLEQHSRASLLHLAAAAEAGALLDTSQKEAAAQLILSGAALFCCRHAMRCVTAMLLTGVLVRPLGAANS